MHTSRRQGAVALSAIAVLVTSSCGTGDGSAENPAIDDVNISACDHSSDPTRGPEAQLTVTNKSSKESTYAITVKFVNSEKTDVLDQVTATVESVAPNETRQAIAFSNQEELRASNPSFLCDIENATRVVSP